MAFTVGKVRYRKIVYLGFCDLTTSVIVIPLNMIHTNQLSAIFGISKEALGRGFANGESRYVSNLTV